MWKTLQELPFFHIKHTENDEFEIFITDYISIWSVKYTKQNFLSRLKECNADTEFEDDDDLLQQGFTMLSEPEKLKKLKVVKQDNGNTLCVHMEMSFGFILCWDMKLLKGTEQFFYEEVTKKLLEIIQSLHSSQYELRMLVRRKDRVIRFCKKQKGVKITAKRLKTKTFNDKEHMTKYNQYENIFGPNEPENMLTKLNESMKKELADVNAFVKLESTTIKVEPETPSNNTVSIQSLTIKEEIKEEINQEIKSEPDTRSNVVPKRRKKFNL